MTSPDKSAIISLLTNGPHHSEVGRKQLTLAFAGLYIASTIPTGSRPYLVWETENAYARYYVPVESVHTSIKHHLDGTDAKNGGPDGDQHSKINVEVLETIKGEGKDNHAEAVLEKVTVNSRSMTWVRFTKGPWKGFFRFERGEIDDWFENGALFAGIKNPHKRIDTSPVSHDFIIKVGGEKVAESKVAVLLNETGLKETYYLPATSICDWGMVEKSDLRTACPYKGEAWYLSLTVKGKKYENSVWYYPYPTHESAGVAGLVSFYNKEEVEILVDGVRI